MQRFEPKPAPERRIWPLALSLGLRLDVVGEIHKRRREADGVFFSRDPVGDVVSDEIDALVRPERDGVREYPVTT